MKHIRSTSVLLTSLLLGAARALATPAVDQMSDIEVSEYAERMSDAIDDINQKKLCQLSDENCLRTAFTQIGISYDDREPVMRRLLLMLGRIH